VRRQPRCGHLAVGQGFQGGETGVESGHGGLGEEGRSRSLEVVERIGRVCSEGVSVIERRFGEVVARGNSGAEWRIGHDCSYYNRWAEWMGSDL
jgi:hypothetical protein